MKNRLRRYLEPSYTWFYSALALLSLVLFYFNRVAGTCAVAAVIVSFALHLRFLIRKRREIAALCESVAFHTDSGATEVSVNAPLPMTIVKADNGDVVWFNDKFAAICGKSYKRFDMSISSLVEGFELKWLFEGKTEYPETVKLGKRAYNVYGSFARSGEVRQAAPSMLASLYWVDVTELSVLKEKIESTSPVYACIVLDNYDEATKNLQDSTKSNLLASIDERIGQWASASSGLLRKFDRDRYVFIFEQNHLQGFIDGRFSVLDQVREMTASAGIPMTLSIGIGKDAENPQEGYKYALLAIDMALSRGGDQVVVKHKFSFDFYGGRTKEMERRTKVKTRIMANALGELISNSSFVIIMGHKHADIDCIGAAAGVTAIARKRGKRAYTVITETTAPGVRDKLKATKEYSEAFIDEQAALLQADRDTLLVVVDTCRPDLVESQALLQSCTRVAVIDHHRRAALYIQGEAFNFHEPSASSACELVTELMRYMLETGDISRAEAEVLLGGIMLDSKNFTMHTGVGTFEAAAYLRGCGADTVNVKRMFQTDLESNVVRYNIISSSKRYHDSCVIAPLDYTVQRSVAAQAADEMLGLTGIGASFVLYPAETQIIVSARSLGDINVQIITEKLGGGGHQTMAGAQLDYLDMELAVSRLKHALDQYFEEM